MSKLSNMKLIKIYFMVLKLLKQNTHVKASEHVSGLLNVAYATKQYEMFHT
jgi:hypothetical protein